MEERRGRGSSADIAGLVPLVVASDIADRRLAAAAAGIEWGLELTRALGWDNQETSLICMQAEIAAVQGREEECRELAGEGLRRGLARGIGWVVALARLALAELEAGLGRPREAIEQLEQLPPGPIPPYAQLATPDLIDAALRLGDRDRALAALERLVAWAPVTRAPAVQGLVARCRAVLADDAQDADELFATALALHREASPFERARTELAYGERLRRDRRRVKARTQLRNALVTFEGLGAAPWAARARQELRASGEIVRRRDATTVDDLTPQELRIAELVAAGASNRDVAGQLFLSPKTVEYHLGKVFVKLGIGSRVELAHTPLAGVGAQREAASA
jgi:DNA-binding CsgD family transcriptional regulator